MAVTNADVIGGQLEKVRPKLQQLYETTTGVGSLIKKASESHRISSWSQALSGGQTLSAFRVPLQLYPGGDYGTFSYDEGDLGGGSMTKFAFFSMAYFPDEYAVEFSQLAQEATATNEQAVANVLKFHLKTAIKEMQTYYDTGLHQDGTGVLATGSGTGAPGVSNPTYNLEPNFGAQRLRLNQPVDIFKADGVTRVSAATDTIRVSAFNNQTKTVTLTGTPSTNAPVNTDKICFRGMASAAAGTWRNGIYSFNNTATSGFTQTVDRSVVTEIVTPSVAASSGSLVPAFGLLGRDQMIQRRDEDALTGLRGISHQSQRAAWYLQGVGISEWHRGANDAMIDIIPKDVKYETTFQMCGVNHLVSKKQDRSRIDWVVPKNYARALLHDLKYFQGPDGQKFFVVRSSTTSNPKAGFLFYLVGAENIISTDPGAGLVISGLGLPSGY